VVGTSSAEEKTRNAEGRLDEKPRVQDDEAQVVLKVFEVRHAALVLRRIADARPDVHGARARPNHAHRRLGVEFEAEGAPEAAHGVHEGCKRVDPHAVERILGAEPEGFDFREGVADAPALHPLGRGVGTEDRHAHHERALIGRRNPEETVDVGGGVLAVGIENAGVGVPGFERRLRRVDNRPALAAVFR